MCIKEQNVLRPVTACTRTSLFTIFQNTFLHDTAIVQLKLPKQ